MDIVNEVTNDDFGFVIDHVGINLSNEAEARQVAATFSNLFNLPIGRDGKSSLYVDDTIEVLKKPGRGTHGHIAIATNDVAGARTWFESRGILFSDESIKRDENGEMTVIYFQDEIAGFAIHLVRKMCAENAKG
ncbi:MAG: hypothetical protein ABFC86_01635 [Rectinema sp.]